MIVVHVCPGSMICDPALLLLQPHRYSLAPIFPLALFFVRSSAILAPSPFDSILRLASSTSHFTAFRRPFLAAWLSGICPRLSFDSTWAPTSTPVISPPSRTKTSLLPDGHSRPCSSMPSIPIHPWCRLLASVMSPLPDGHPIQRHLPPLTVLRINLSAALLRQPFRPF